MKKIKLEDKELKEIDNEQKIKKIWDFLRFKKRSHSIVCIIYIFWYSRRNHTKLFAYSIND